MSRGATAPGVGINGVGVVSGYGWGRKHLQQGLLSGISAVRPLALHDPERPAWAAHLLADKDPAEGEDLAADATRLAVREALQDAHDRGWRPGAIVGLVHCVSPELRHGDAPIVSEVAREHGVHGPVAGVDALTASSVASLLTAMGWIEAGLADDVLVLNVDLSAATAPGTMPPAPGALAAPAGPALDACRPFQPGSRGFLCGEAAVAMVVSADTRGSYASVLGGALAYDERRVDPPGLDANAVRRAHIAALSQAGVAGGEVAYLNAEGSGLPDCDAVEAAAFDELYPLAGGLFSVKPLVGHCLEAAGAIELCASLYGFETGVIPAAPRRVAGHPRLLDGPTAAADGPVVKASLGTSGHYGVLVLGRPAA